MLSGHFSDQFQFKLLCFQSYVPTQNKKNDKLFLDLSKGWSLFYCLYPMNILYSLAIINIHKTLSQYKLQYTLFLFSRDKYF